MVQRYPDLEPALGYMQFPYTDRDITQYDIPVQTEYGHQTLSDFQRNKMLDDSIDYLMQNPVQQNYVKYQDWRDPGMDYGQRIWDSKKGEYRNNPQAMQNIWRMHGENDWERWKDLEKLYGDERRVPASVPIPHHDRPAGYQDFQPNWDYIDSLENFKEYGGDIRMMNTADAYKDIDKWIKDPEGNYIRNPEANVGGVNVGETLSGTGGYFKSSTGNITLNPANVVKKYPTAPMGPDSEWEFLGPNEVNVNTPYFDPLKIWNLGRILPHETGHFQEDADVIMGWDEPNPGAYLEGNRWGSYTSPYHPRMHGMDASQWDWRSADWEDRSLSKTQFANLQAAQQKGLESSLNKIYWGDDKTFEQDWERAGQGFGGSGRSRTDDKGRSTYQSPASKDPDRPGPGRHHFDTGGIAGLPGGQWSSSVIEGDEEIYDIKPLQMDPGIMSIDDLEDLFEEAGLDKRIIYQLINTGGLSQLVS